MKKQALELVRRIYNGLKFDIPHGDLEDIFNGAVTQAKLFCDVMTDENPERKEKYKTMYNRVT